MQCWMGDRGLLGEASHPAAAHGECERSGWSEIVNGARQVYGGNTCRNAVYRILDAQLLVEGCHRDCGEGPTTFAFEHREVGLTMGQCVISASRHGAARFGVSARNGAVDGLLECWYGDLGVFQADDSPDDYSDISNCGSSSWGALVNGEEFNILGQGCDTAVYALEYQSSTAWVPYEVEYTGCYAEASDCAADDSSTRFKTMLPGVTLMDCARIAKTEGSMEFGVSAPGAPPSLPQYMHPCCGAIGDAASAAPPDLCHAPLRSRRRQIYGQHGGLLVRPLERRVQ